MFSWLASPEAWVALGTLTALEIVLGIDNIIFISVLVGRLPTQKRNLARNAGLVLAMLSRLRTAFLHCMGSRFDRALVQYFGQEYQAEILSDWRRNVSLAKATHEVHASLEGAVEKKTRCDGGGHGCGSFSDCDFGYSVFPRFGCHRRWPGAAYFHYGHCYYYCRRRHVVCREIHQHFVDNHLTINARVFFFDPCRRNADSRGFRSARTEGLHIFCHGLFGFVEMLICACAPEKLSRFNFAKRFMASHFPDDENSGATQSILPAAIILKIRTFFANVFPIPAPAQNPPRPAATLFSGRRCRIISKPASDRWSVKTSRSRRSSRSIQKPRLFCF